MKTITLIGTSRILKVEKELVYKIAGDAETKRFIVYRETKGKLKEIGNFESYIEAITNIVINAHDSGFDSLRVK